MSSPGPIEDPSAPESASAPGAPEPSAAPIQIPAVQASPAVMPVTEPEPVTAVEPVPAQQPPAGQAPGAYPGYPGYPSYSGYPSYPGYPPPARPQESSNAVIALVLAVASWVVCPIIPAIVALVFAARADREIAASQGAITGQGLNTASKVVAWINIGVWGAVILVSAAFVFIALAIGVASSPSLGT